ncbi:hypothetical protein PTKIN_Ptkin16aG0098600 [Pterospermum kingtungense]
MATSCKNSLTIVPVPTVASSMKIGGSTTALAPGFRFHPSDEELVSYYLKRKVLNKTIRFNPIGEVDIYKHEPWDLSVMSRFKSRDHEWYFFSSLDKKYENGARMNRATNQGYWKATGKDREIRHNSQVAGMKKTLVFHGGRAPSGLRTNWVMHEYRLVEEETERIGALQEYVVCRVFRKSNIGPPNGHRYAPFVEAEWDDDDDGSAVVIPGVDVAASNEAIAADEVAAAENAIIESNGVPRIGLEQDIQYVPEDAPSDEVPRESLDKRTDDSPPLCVLNREANSPVHQYKRRRHYDLDLNRAIASENLTITTQDSCSSTTVAAAAAATTSLSSATTNAISALLEFSLMEPIEPKEKPHIPAPVFDTAKLDTVMPPDCMKLINRLQNELHKVSVEKESLKLEMISAQAMINILQSRIDFLTKENEDLKRSNRNA